MKFSNFKSAEKFLGEIQLIASQLNARRKPIGDDTLVIIILSNLKNKRYGNLVLSLKHGDEAALELPNVVNVLLDEGKDVENIKAEQCRGPQAVQGHLIIDRHAHCDRSSRRPTAFQAQHRAETRRCYECGRIGNLGKDCSERNQPSRFREGPNRLRPALSQYSSRSRRNQVAMVAGQ